MNFVKCEGKFNLKNDLKKHFRRIHEEDKKASCHLCNQDFFDNKDLGNHLLNQHKESQIKHN